MDLIGLSIDGKSVRGAGRPARRGSSVEVGPSRRAGAGTDRGGTANEITTAPALLASRDLAGTVITADKMLTQRSLAEQIRAQNGDYLLAVKGNQPEMQTAIVELFANTAWHQHAPAEAY